MATSNRCDTASEAQRAPAKIHQDVLRTFLRHDRHAGGVQSLRSGEARDVINQPSRGHEDSAVIDTSTRSCCIDDVFKARTPLFSLSLFSVLMAPRSSNKPKKSSAAAPGSRRQCSNTSSSRKRPVSLRVIIYRDLPIMLDCQYARVDHQW